MTSKRLKVSIIYLVVVLLTLIMRVASALDIYSALGINDADAFWTIIIQIIIFGIVPFVLYMIFVASKQDKELLYFPKRKAKETDQEEQLSFVGTEYQRDADSLPKELENKEETKGEKTKKAFNAFLHDFGFKKVSGRDALRTFVLAICMIVVGSAVSMVWQMVLSLVGYTRSPSDTDYSSVGILFKEIFFVAVLPGFFEEFSHRGLINAGYKETGWKFVLISALFFSLMHQNIVQTGYTFTDGLMMALVMYYTGSIWPSIFMHFLNNAWSVFLGYVSDAGGAFSFIISVENWLYSTVGGLLVCIVVVLLCAVLIALMFWRMRNEAVKMARIDDKPFKNTLAYPVAKDLVFWLTIAVGVAATVFSLVWGIMR